MVLSGLVRTGDLLLLSGDAELFKRYENLALETPDVWFAGRPATYPYYNMDQVLGLALATFRRINETLPKRRIRGPGRPNPRRLENCHRSSIDSPDRECKVGDETRRLEGEHLASVFQLVLGDGTIVFGVPEGQP